VSDVMNRRVVVVPPTASLKEAVDTLQREQVTGLVVQEGPHVRGLLTERDLARHALQSGAHAAVGEVLHRRPPVTCHEHDFLADALALLKRHHRPALPVLDDRGAVTGVLSLTEAAASLPPEAAVTWLEDIRGTR